jgi:hypothetical protein
MDPLFQNFLRSRGVPVSTPVDPIGTRSYQQLGQRATDVLQRNIPQTFQGAGFQNVPTNFIDDLNRLEQMPAGAAKESARSQLQQNLRMQSRLQGGPPKISGGQSATGALIAPSIGSQGSRPRLNWNVAPSTYLGVSGSPYTTDYGLSRQAGIPQMAADIRKANTPRPFAGNAPKNFSPLGQAPSTAPPVGRQSGSGTARIVGNAPTRQGFKGAGSALLKRATPLVDAALIGYDVYDATQTGRDPVRAGIRSTLQVGGGVLGGAAGGLVGLPTTGPGGFVTTMGGYALGSEATGRAFDAMFPEVTAPQYKDNFVYGTRPGTGRFVPKQGGGVEWVEAEGLIGPVPQSKPNVKFKEEDWEGLDPMFVEVLKRSNSPVVDRSTTPTSDPRNTDLPVSAEQVAPVDPYAYQLSVYGQGRQAANSQEAMNKVRDLGLAIHQAKYPQFYRESYNPLMAATFPERYQKTPENFVVQQGIQVPSAMTAKDSRAELLQSEEEANIERLDQSTAAVEAFLANYLNKGAK